MIFFKNLSFLIFRVNKSKNSFSVRLIDFEFFLFLIIKKFNFLVESEVEITVLSLFESGEGNNTVTHILNVDFVLSSFINMNVLGISHSVSVWKLKFFFFLVDISIEIVDSTHSCQFDRFFNWRIIFVVDWTVFSVKVNFD